MPILGKSSAKGLAHGLDRSAGMSHNVEMQTPFGIWLPQVTVLRCQQFEQASDAVALGHWPPHRAAALPLGAAP